MRAHILYDTKTNRQDELPTRLEALHLKADEFADERFLAALSKCLRLGGVITVSIRGEEGMHVWGDEDMFNELNEDNGQ